MMNELNVREVSYAYRSKYQTVQAVKDVSLCLKSGLLYALIGKSGSGKSTLLSMLAGLEKTESGEIVVNGKNLTSMNLDEYRRKYCGVIYQSFNLFPLMTVLENVMYPLFLNKVSKQEAEKRAQETLTKVGLGSDYWRRLPTMLSGGEQQRVAIARVLANENPIVLADEPTGNLDRENAQQIIDLLWQLAHEQGRCVLVVTHDMEIAEQADTVFRMESGQLTEGGL